MASKDNPALSTPVDFIDLTQDSPINLSRRENKNVPSLNGPTRRSHASLRNRLSVIHDQSCGKLKNLVLNKENWNPDQAIILSLEDENLDSINPVFSDISSEVPSFNGSKEVALLNPLTADSISRNIPRLPIIQNCSSNS